MDSIPIVCLTGQVPTHLIGNDAFQEADTTGITRPCTKHNYLVKDVNDLAAHRPRGVPRRAHAAGPGPVVVDLPKDVLSARRDYVGADNRSSTRATTRSASPIRRGRRGGRADGQRQAAACSTPAAA